MKPFRCPHDLFFSFLFLTASFSLQASSSSLTGSAKDTQQLLSFKATLPSPTLLPNWLPNQNPCKFTGVFCKDGTRVSSLDLSNTPLVSDLHSVSSLLLTIDYLESLSLKSTNLTGTISALSASRCGASLLDVDLSSNALTGSLTDLSSFTSTSCSSLKSLNLSANSLDFSKPDSTELQLNSIESLDFSYNRIFGANVVAYIVSNGCDELKHLSLKSNKVTGNIPISNCKSLEFLDLSSNNFSTGIPSFGDCLSLQHLDLSSNKFHGDIGNALIACQQLTFLNLSSNQFSGPIPSVPTGKLQSLFLSGNDFQGGIPLGIADACPTLLQLDLSKNNLSGTVPNSLGTCSSLEYIDISANNFSGDLPIDTLIKMSNLKKLVLSYNNFIGVLPDSLSLLTNLESLDVSSNNISGLIPSGLCQDPKNSLKELYLQNNLLTGLIPESLGNCSQLVSLDLSFNYLTGTIPASFGSLSNLRDLIIWLNHLHGEIPQELMKIRTLENLILDFNELTGTIPSGLSNCTNLNWISLSNNRLSGEIPAWIGQLSSLAILKLSNNSFYGNIPPELGNCRSLIWLDLNSNRLSGSIPPALFKQSVNIAVGLVGKRYAYIKADGSKECHGAGNLLEFAGIRQEQLNRISGRSPCNFTRVYGGKTQPTFNHDGSMIFLDLSYNMLSGSIPKELGVMLYLYILNLGHNNLSGPIPQELGGLKNVNILDLSSNRFEGTIPQSLGELTLLLEINLSNNNLSGMIPGSNQFETFPVDSFLNNSGLCGLPLPPCGGDRGSSLNSQHQKSHRKQASLAGSVAMGLLFSLFCIFGLILVALETRKRRKKKDSTLDVYIDSRSHSGTANTSWKLTGAREALSINLATFEKPLRKLTFADLLEATNGFHNDSLIGSGGFGDVYKAQLKDGSIVAIKKLIHISGQGDRDAMDTHLSVSTLAGTPGYVPPEYYQSFRCSTRGDVYSYGVVLLELLTGKQPTDSADFGDNNLVGWVKQHAKLRISDVFDPELLKEDPSLEIELLQHLRVASACLDDRPWRRPTMIQVMAMFKEIQAGSGIDSSSTIAPEDGSFTAEMLEMTIKEGTELGKP
ncbi:hypothetical protein L1049_002475 [Liquidambar formosana]|uniref:non-specific serine/threonine protein kinase n=1 Tax=Liquidambar formosana TaxID=63359 RepID=A0AAP0NH77_LIQFO